MRTEKRQPSVGGGHTYGTKRREIFCRVPLFWLCEYNISRFGERTFVMVSTVWSVSCLLFSQFTPPRPQPFVKVGARAPVPYGVGVTVFMSPTVWDHVVKVT